MRELGYDRDGKRLLFDADGDITGREPAIYGSLEITPLKDKYRYDDRETLRKDVELLVKGLLELKDSDTLKQLRTAFRPPQVNVRSVGSSVATKVTAVKAPSG